ncbi:MAG: hypothetical protein JO311_03010 [Candidatus Eremiobacteraeota bacterium]|nr:hypothetical protein [Candidatus Eremiobacteraeota bacterium]
MNPEFKPTPGKPGDQYLQTQLNPKTNRPYPGGQEVRLDDDNRPQYLEEPWATVTSRNVNIGDFLFRAFYDAAHKGVRSIDVATLTKRFLHVTNPQPLHVDGTRLNAALLRIGDAQRQALIVPPMLIADASGQALEIGDQRLFIYLQSLAADDLEEFLDAAYPNQWPSPRRRNYISTPMTDEETDEAIKSALS